MKPGFYTIMAAQFFSSLADNALLIASIALLAQLSAPGEVTPLLKFFFTTAYVLLAAFVGSFADSRPKGQVMFMTNTVKVIGCLALILSDHWAVPGLPAYANVLFAYAIVGIGAAAYSPAKYGILTELLPAKDLVKANGWIEGLTVASIVLGTVIGGALISPMLSHHLLAFSIPGINIGIDTAPEAAMCAIGVIYIIAAVLNLFIPNTCAIYPPAPKGVIALVKKFSHSCKVLWTDSLGKISLAVTTLFWGAGATLQFMILKWASSQLGMPLHKAAILQGVVAIGVAVGAILAARFISLKKSLIVLPMGVLMGLGVCSLTLVHSFMVAVPLLIIVGALAGFFVVPMNALLQHRGHTLLSAGQSIAVQNFNENLSILAMLATYSLMVKMDFSMNALVLIFGLFISVAMGLIIYWKKKTEVCCEHLETVIDDHHIPVDCTQTKKEGITE